MTQTVQAKDAPGFADDIAQALRSIACLAHLDDVSLAAFAAQGRAVSYAAGDIVGGPASGLASVAMLCEGSVRVSYPPDRHGEVAYHDVPAGGLFGHIEALANHTPNLSAVCLTATRVVLVPASAFVGLLEDSPKVALALLRIQAHDAVNAAPRKPGVAHAGAHKLYAELLRMAEPDPNMPGELTIARLPRHRELAQWTDLHEDDVAAALAALVKTGCAARRYPGLGILDADRLRVLAVGQETNTEDTASRP